MVDVFWIGEDVELAESRHARLGEHDSGTTQQAEQDSGIWKEEREKQFNEGTYSLGGNDSPLVDRVSVSYTPSVYGSCMSHLEACKRATGDC